MSGLRSCLDIPVICSISATRVMGITVHWLTAPFVIPSSLARAVLLPLTLKYFKKSLFMYKRIVELYLNCKRKNIVVLSHTNFERVSL